MAKTSVTIFKPVVGVPSTVAAVLGVAGAVSPGLLSTYASSQRVPAGVGGAAAAGGISASGTGSSGTLTARPADGQWAQYGLNTVLDVAGPSPNSGARPMGGAGSSTYLEVYSGGIWNPKIGKYGRLWLAPAGGHASYDGNDHYDFDIETRLVALVKATYSNTATGPNSFGEYPDGSPFPPHAWSTVGFLPLGAQGTLVLTQTYTSAADANARTAISHLFDRAAGTWARGADFVNPLHPAVAYDNARRVLWHFAESNGPMRRFDGTTVTPYSGNNYAIAADTCMTVDTRRDQVVHYADNASGTAGTLYVTQGNNPNALATAISLNTGPGNDAAFHYVPHLDRILAWSGNGSTVYVLNPNNYAAGWTTIGTGSTVTPPTVTNFTNAGACGKCQYAPALGALVSIGGNDQRAYAFGIPGVPKADTEASCWNSRISGSGVLAYHNFESAAEVNAFRWVEAYGCDPGDTRDPGKLAWDNSQGFANGGHVKAIRPAGTVENQANWWRPWSPLTGASNGRGVDDPGANGTVPVRTLIAVQGQTTITNFGDFGYVTDPSYVSADGAIGSEIWIQARVKMDPNRIAGSNASIEGGKFFFFTTNKAAFTSQEIVVESGFSDGGTPAKNAFMMYRSGGASLPGDEIGLGLQPGGSVGLVGNGTANWADSTRANFWTWPTGWVTMLWRIKPGPAGSGATTIETWVCEWGESVYRRIWSQTHANMSYSVSGKRGYNATIFDSYINGLNINPGFTNRVTQLIWSLNYIPPPRYYASAASP